MRGTASAAARVFLAAGSVAMIAASVVGGTFAAMIFVGVATLFPVALIAVGASRGGRLGRVGPLLGALALVLAGSALVLVILRPSGWFLGLPTATVLMLVGLGLAPLLLVALGYAATSD